MFEIKEGSFYVRRSGDIIGPMKYCEHETHPWRDASDNGYSKYGRWYVDGPDHLRDIIEEINLNKDVFIVHCVGLTEPNIYSSNNLDKAKSRAESVARAYPNNEVFILANIFIAKSVVSVDLTSTRYIEYLKHFNQETINEVSN